MKVATLLSTFCISLLLVVSVSAASKYAPAYYEKLKAPSHLDADTLSSSAIALSWNYQRGSYTFKVYRAASQKGQYKLIGNTKSRSYTDKNLSSGTTYYYKVKAVQQSGRREQESPFSRSIKARTDRTTTPIAICPTPFENTAYCMNETSGAEHIQVDISSKNNDRYYALANLDKSVVGHWRFENNSNDDSGNEYELRMVNNAAFGSGLFGSTFDVTSGFGGYATASVSMDHPALFITDDLTISAWIYINETAHHSREFYPVVSLQSSRLPITPYFLDIIYSDSSMSKIGLHSYGFGPTLNVIVDAPMITQNAWHHIVVVSDYENMTQTAQVYVDGVLIGSVTNELSAPRDVMSEDAFLSIGAELYYSGANFPGMIDELIIMNRTVTGTEVSALYNAQATPLKTSIPVSAGEHSIQGIAVTTTGVLSKTATKVVTI